MLIVNPYHALYIECEQEKHVNRFSDMIGILNSKEPTLKGGPPAQPYYDQLT